MTPFPNFLPPRQLQLFPLILSVYVYYKHVYIALPLNSLAPLPYTDVAKPQTCLNRTLPILCLYPCIDVAGKYTHEHSGHEPYVNI